MTGTAEPGVSAARITAPIALDGLRRPGFRRWDSGGVTIVHTGDVAEHRALRALLESKGYAFDSDTHAEVVAHLIHCLHRKIGDLFHAVHSAAGVLGGRYALAAVSARAPDRLVAARQGSPLMIGIAPDGQLLVSDTAATLPPPQRCIFLEDGDVAELCGAELRILDRRGNLAVHSLATD